MFEMLANANGEILPEALHFLHWGWWVVHLIAIPGMFVIGYAVGMRKPVRRQGPPPNP